MYFISEYDKTTRAILALARLLQSRVNKGREASGSVDEKLIIFKKVHWKHHMHCCSIANFFSLSIG